MTERNPREGIREELRQKIMEQLQECSRMEDDELYEQIDRAIREKGQELFLPLKERLWLRSSLYDSFRRLDILQELLDDRNVTEIMVNGAGKIFIERKDGTALWERRFERPEQLEDIIQQIVGRVNRVVNVSSPIADARLEDGSRVHIVLPPVCAGRPGGDYTKVSGTDHDGKADWLWGCYRGSGTVSGRAGSCPVQYFCQRGNQFRKDDIFKCPVILYSKDGAGNYH